MAKKKLDDKMKQQILDYKNNIKTEENFVTIVRQMPGMYIGYIGNKGYLNMIREVFQNSLDEMMKKKSPCDLIIVSYDERTHMVIIQDNGRGIPYGEMIRIFSKQHTSSNYDKEDGEFSSGVHGVGAKVSNALSKTFKVESYILGEGREINYIDGVPTPREEKIIENNNGLQGTIVTMTPCYEVLGEITINCADVLHLLKSIVSLSNIGNTVIFNGILYSGQQIQETIVNETGIYGLLLNYVAEPLVQPIVISNLQPDMKTDIVFTYDFGTVSDRETIVSFSNFCPTIGGTHVEGFTDGLTKFFKDYMNKIYLSGGKTTKGKKDNKLVITNNDVKSGLVAVVTSSHLHPMFQGQAKDILSNGDMQPFVKETTLAALEEWAKNSPKDLQKVCKYLKDVAEIRAKAEGGKVKLKDKYESSSLTGLPKKYDAPTGKTDLELIIVEGDSAKGSAKNTRCKARQGLYPIRGKLPNALTTRKKKFLENAEVAGLLSIFGGGYGKNFDLSKVKWSKIIIMADADPDGAHIRTLLLKFMLAYCRALVEDGRVYGAMPPLYGLEYKKDKYRYFTDRSDYVKYLQKEFCKSNNIKTFSGLDLTDREIIAILFNNIDYVYDVETIANRYSVNPLLLELILINRKVGYTELKSLIEKQYRFLKVNELNGTIIVEGLVDSKYQTLFLNEKLIQDSMTIIYDIEHSDVMYFKLNDKKASLYQLMKAFESASPKSIQRYKGLGEMKGTQLKESTLHPDMDRTLIQYTVESITDELEMIKYYESNRKELVEGLKATRMDLLG